MMKARIGKCLTFCFAASFCAAILAAQVSAAGQTMIQDFNGSVTWGDETRSWFWGDNSFSAGKATVADGQLKVTFTGGKNAFSYKLGVCDSQSSVAFWLDTGSCGDQTLKLNLTAGSDWAELNTGKFGLISDGGGETQDDVAEGKIHVPAGFKGFVVIPFSCYSSSALRSSDMCGIDFSFESTKADESVLMDDLQLLGSGAEPVHSAVSITAKPTQAPTVPEPDDNKTTAPNTTVGDNATTAQQDGEPTTVPTEQPAESGDSGSSTESTNAIVLEAPRSSSDTSDVQVGGSKSNGLNATVIVLIVVGAAVVLGGAAAVVFYVIRKKKAA